MKRLELEYVKSRHPVGRRILFIAVLTTVVLGVLYADLKHESERWQVASAKISVRPASVAAQADAARLTQEVEQANDVVRKLSLPWDELFKAMEKSAIDKVALLSVQPDPQQKIVSLNGEAQAYSDLLTYVLRLDSSGTLAKVRLVNHEIKRDDPQHPVSFSVTAQWKVTP